jgi:hypothetical protein
MLRTGRDLSHRWIPALAGCVGVLLSAPILAQTPNINAGAIANESRRQEQRMERDLARPKRTVPSVSQSSTRGGAAKPKKRPR